MVSYNGRIYREIDWRVYARCNILGATGKFKSNISLSAAVKIAVYKGGLLEYYYVWIKISLWYRGILF